MAVEAAILITAEVAEDAMSAPTYPITMEKGYPTTPVLHVLLPGNRNLPVCPRAYLMAEAVEDILFRPMTRMPQRQAPEIPPGEALIEKTMVARAVGRLMKTRGFFPAFSWVAAAAADTPTIMKAAPEVTAAD